MIIFAIKWFLRIVFRIKVQNKENFPLDGPVIVCFNHSSNWDVPLVYTTLPRKLCFMAKKELFDIFLIKSLVKKSGAFPVARGIGDIGAIKAAMSVLKENKALAMFPEGRRVKKGQKHVAKPGVAMIAYKAGVPILPVAISGEYKLFHKLTIIIGKPMHVTAPEGEKLTNDDFLKISNDILNQILTMAGEQSLGN